ncbi:MAG: hypothetical protein A2Y17_00330 [Clostridiales bacterium GWF2_38_85]|nr:MAG: hypothetical protein A2Y17_00330 [Clostridiales bacterium GWF2_38_85]HBL83907.1 hypothetical protein [Clostridiales bacterium]
MAATDDFLKTMSEITKESGKYAKELFDKGYDKAKTIAEVTKLNIDLSNQKRTLDRLYTELGKLYYVNRQSGENERIKAVCAKIDTSRVAIDNLELTIELTRNPKKSETDEESQNEAAKTPEPDSEAVELIICTECGAENIQDEEFCIGCGKLLKSE